MYKLQFFTFILENSKLSWNNADLALYMCELLAHVEVPHDTPLCHNTCTTNHVAKIEKYNCDIKWCLQQPLVMYHLLELVGLFKNIGSRLNWML